MNVFRVCAAAVISLSVAGCISHDVDGTGITPDAIAALRYVNLVPDTGALTFRIVDVINNAPSSIGATFRTGGNPYGSGTTLPPGGRHAYLLVPSCHLVKIPSFSRRSVERPTIIVMSHNRKLW